MTISAVLLALSLVSLAAKGLNLGIDFTGGVVMDITAAQPASTGDVSAVVAAQHVVGAQVQARGSTGTQFELRLPPMSHDAELALEGALQAKFGAPGSQAAAPPPASSPTSASSQTSPSASASASGASGSEAGPSSAASGPGPTASGSAAPPATAGASVVDSVNLVAPTIGQQLRTHAILAVIIATALMTAYLGLRFQVGEGGVYAGLKFALAAIIALLHDLLLTIGVFSFFHLTVDSNFVAAVLTIYGYAMNDKIIVFDRIRERLRDRHRESLVELIDVSLNQVLNRTVITVATVLLALVAVYLLGGASTRVLALALIIGVCFGTYSSVFIASPIFMWLAGRDRRSGFGRGAAGARPVRA